jgi:hypothetical protein
MEAVLEERCNCEKDDEIEGVEYDPMLRKPTSDHCMKESIQDYNPGEDRVEGSLR